jgi:hypothetical protein
MLRSLGLALLLSLLTASAAGAATLEPIGTFEEPVFVTSDPVEPDRLFVVEQPGRVAEVLDGAAPELYADLSEFVACCGERGLLSIALAADFHKSGLFYAAYTGEPAAGGAQGDLHVDAFVADADAEVTRTPILSIPHNQAGNHNGGQLQLGPDGYLYISTGDGGGGGDPFENGQDLTELLGKVLRVDPQPGTSPAYSIPPGNPFAGATPGADEIWAYGLRNPWRFSFDSLTGDMLVADVGQGLREEVDLAASPAPGVVGGAGANYGWSCREGLIAYPDDGTPTLNCHGVSNFTDPIFDYPHSGQAPGAAYGCSITGGYVVRDASLGDLYGRYVYADYCVSEIRSLAMTTAGASVLDRSEGIDLQDYTVTSFGEDSCGRLYVASAGEVLRFEGATPAVCPENPEEEPPGEEEPPKEEPVPENPPAAQPPPLVDLPPAPVRRAAIALDGRFSQAVAISVRLLPCGPASDDSAQLNRGGRTLATKPLDGDCRARFFVTGVGGRATFRALARPAADAVWVRSRRLSVAAPSAR